MELKESHLALIIAGKNIPKKQILDYADSFIVCADSGANNLIGTKIIPGIIIGDMDSISEKAMKKFRKIPKLVFPKEKDKTDLELAIDYCEKKKSNGILVLIDFTRMDHLLSAIDLMQERTTKIKLISQNSEVELLKEKESKIIPKKIKNRKSKEFVSIISRAKKSVVEIQGMAYSGKFEIRKGTSLGLSNELREKKGIIKVLKGIVLVVKSVEGFK